MIASYANGNTRVTLYADGTKVREWDGDAAPECPESIDLSGGGGTGSAR